MDADMVIAGRFEERLHRYPVRVYFEDTDLSGMVYHANYLRYFERARSDMLRLVGVDQRAAHDAGEGAYAVRSMALDWHAPARLDDMLAVESRLVAIRGASVDIHQTVRRERTILATASVLVAFVAPDGRPRRQPAGWTDAFRTKLWEGDKGAWI